MGGDVMMLLMRRRSFVSCSYPCTTKRVVKVSPLKSQYGSLVQLFRKNKEWAAIFYWFLVVRQEDKLQSPLSLESWQVRGEHSLSSHFTISHLSTSGGEQRLVLFSHTGSGAQLSKVLKKYLKKPVFQKIGKKFLAQLSHKNFLWE